MVEGLPAAHRPGFVGDIGLVAGALDCEALELGCLSIHAVLATARRLVTHLLAVASGVPSSLSCRIVVQSISDGSDGSALPES